MFGQYQRYRACKHGEGLGVHVYLAVLRIDPTVDSAIARFEHARPGIGVVSRGGRRHAALLDVLLGRQHRRGTESRTTQKQPPSTRVSHRPPFALPDPLVSVSAPIHVYRLPARGAPKFTSCLGRWSQRRISTSAPIESQYAAACARWWRQARRRAGGRGTVVFDVGFRCAVLP